MSDRAKWFWHNGFGELPHGNFEEGDLTSHFSRLMRNDKQIVAGCDTCQIVEPCHALTLVEYCSFADQFPPQARKRISYDNQLGRLMLDGVAVALL